MSNETKQDVFEDALRALEEFSEQGSSWEMAYDGLSTRYSVASDAALPDDLPVIPKVVSEYIEDAKAGHYELLDAMTKWTLDQPVFDWIHDNSDTFARAWVLGIWRVEETGEIVKLEE
ncbi:DUF1642 domain-containing protein [Furfurilactobacillus siliginis]|uniref:DUF1642 domain-containing protein n=2 Tax=Furfurilactobacillus siliginis TaxID=348151 RepID=A0A510VPN5_9LACO|nr:DUF1642 domain-containing protein [Furfurilactobacillus siliginis]GEK28889.1 hypothetical protein LSI01_12000 [Furfurilactobacillus siliginis]